MSEALAAGLAIDQAVEMAAQIHSEGYVVIPEALSPNDVGRLEIELNFDTLNINANPTGAVGLNHFRYLPNVIARSQQAYNLVTCEAVLELCRQFFQGPFHLINNRALSNRGTMRMLWHTDNDLHASDGSLLGRHPLQGLQFVLYLNDARQRPLQLLRGSQRWSGAMQEQYLSMQEVSRSHGRSVVEVQPAAGTLVVMHTHLFHRAMRYRNTGNERNLLLFQFDQTDAEESDHGEALLLNAAYLDTLTPELIAILRLGKPRRAPAFPNTSLETLSLAECLRLQGRLLPQLLRVAMRGLITRTMPEARVIRMKQARIEHNRRRAAGLATKPQAPC